MAIILVVATLAACCFLPATNANPLLAASKVASSSEEVPNVADSAVADSMEKRAVHTVYAYDADPNARVPPPFVYAEPLIIKRGGGGYDDGGSMPGVLRFGKRAFAPRFVDDGGVVLMKKEMPGVLRFGKRDLDSAEIPAGVLRFGKREDAIPGVLRFGKRESDIPGVLRFGKREDAIPGVLRFGKRDVDMPGVLRFGKRDADIPGVLRFGKRESGEMPGVLRFGRRRR
jgi:hypothetical protein